MADRIDSNMLIIEKASEENRYKIKYNQKYIKNLVRFIGDLVPEVRTIFLRQIYNLRTINIIMDSGIAQKEIEEFVRFIAS